MTENNNRELIIERVFDAPREKVFNAWIKPELVSQWWGPNGVTNPVCNIDARPGGKLRIVMLAGEELGNLRGSEWPVEGTFQEVLPPEKIVYAATAILDNKPIMESINTITFEESGGKTKMRLHVVVTNATPEAEGPLSGMSAGWTQSIDKLAKQISGYLN